MGFSKGKSQMEDDYNLTLPREMWTTILLEASSKDWDSITKTCKTFRSILESSHFRNLWRPKRTIYTTTFHTIVIPKTCEISSFIRIPEGYGRAYGPMLCWPCKVTRLTKIIDRTSINLYILKGRYVGTREECVFACRQYAIIED